MERGSYQELLSAVTLERFRRRPVECFLNVGETPQRTGGGDVLRVLIFGTDRTSLHPPLHTHTQTHSDSPTAQLFTSGRGIWYLQQQPDYYYTTSRLKAVGRRLKGGHPRRGLKKQEQIGSVLLM